MTLRRLLPLLTGLSLAGAAAATAAPEPLWELNLVGDMYPEGRALTHPTPEKPTFYFPVVLGFETKGGVVANDPAPPVRDMVHNLAAALAQQGYLASREVPPPPGTPAGAKVVMPPPQLLLILQWGSLRAQTIGDGGDVTTSTAPEEVINKGQMLGLTAGRNLDMNYGFDDASRKLMDSIGDDRYFVIVSAYDYDAYFKHHKRVRLWVAKLSVPASGENMTNVMPTLIKQGAIVFGQETQKPKVVTVPAIRSGTVSVGTAVEVSTPQTQTSAPKP